MDFISSTGPQAEIERLEARIEALAAKIENCRKIMLAARIVIAFGGVLAVAMITGLLWPDPLVLVTSIVALLGGVVLLGSNRSTAAEAREQLEEVEIKRDEWIGALRLRDLGPPALH